MKTKTNKQFMMLSVIGIIIMITCHLAGEYYKYIKFFPFIIIFIFISGYFYNEKHEENIKQYIWKKFKKLMIPFFIINLIYGIINYILRKNGIINYGSDITLYTLFIQPFINNSQFVFNFPAWFVPTLFLVNCSYIIIHKISKKSRILNNYVLLVIFIILQMITVYFRNVAQNQTLIVAVFKVVFFLPFFHLGVLYKDKWQKYDDKIPTIPYLIVLWAIDFALTKNLGDLIYDMHDFSGFQTNSLILPFITSIISILFYTRIARVLSGFLGDNKFINYISNHTYAIMTHHIFIMFMITSILNVVKAPYFNMERYQNGWIYIYEIPNWNYLLHLIYIIVGITGPLLLQLIYDKIKDMIKQKKGELINEK